MPYSTPSSATVLTALQRHCGLYVSVLAPALNALAAEGRVVTQSQRLGDASLHKENASTRHRLGLRCVCTALNALRLEP